MKMKWNRIAILGLICALMLLTSAAAIEVKSPRAPQWPDPAVRDVVIHNRGNITTTVENYGYIGGFKSAGEPSGRWPASTTHDYLAEMKFWIGGIDDDENVYLDNTGDDFNPLPSLISGTESYNIRLSTDTTRYDYDPTDTIGTGLGNPAKGWKIWDAQQSQWVYDKVYNVVDSQFHNGGPLGEQVSVCRFGDDGSGRANMGVVVTQTVRQWDYDYNKDMIFFNLQITNTSARNYHDFAIGLYCDFDIGGQDPVSGDNGRLGDMVNFDSTLSLAWTYDADGYDPAWGHTVRTGFMGTVILSTPGNIGMTAFRTGQWEYLPSTDAGRFDMINSTQYDQSLPPTDQYYVQAVRGINLLAGQTVEFSYALVAAPTDSLLRGIARRAKALFDNNYIGPKPPTGPIVKATARNHSIRLKWDNIAESSVEPTTGLQDFKGYRIYRSTDQGSTWGTPVTNPDYSTGPGYYEIAFFEKDALGRIAHTYIDSNLTNGLVYWYAVCAYDTGTANLGIGALQNPLGSPTANRNVVEVEPRCDPLGYKSPQATIVHTYAGNWQKSTDGISVYVIDGSGITGDDYRVTFSEDCLGLYWNLINATTGDTLLKNQDEIDDVPNNYPVTDGLQVVVNNAVREPTSVYQSAFAALNDTTCHLDFIQEFDAGYGCNANFRNTVEIRFTSAGSTAYDWLTHNPVHVPFEVWNVTTNTQLGSWIADWSGDGGWTVGDEDYIILTNYAYDNGAYHPEVRADYLTWMLGVLPSLSPVTGDVLSIVGPRLLSPEDQFAFSSNKIVASYAAQNLNKVKVVPNPYIGNASWETTSGIRRIQFINLPTRCDIRVYTLSGDLVRTINHTNGTGAEDWDMQSETGREIAAGVYFFNIDSQYGKFTGKFAVIK